MSSNNPSTRLPGGVVNVSQSDLFADLRQPDPTIYHQYYEDFDTYTAAEWVVTETDSGATEALTAGDGGWLLLTNTAGATDLVALQKTPAAWLLEVGKKTFFRCRFKVNDATNTDVVFGLQVVDVTPLDVTDGIYFLKPSTAATVNIVCRKDAATGSTSATSIATMADDTFIELGWYYDGVDTLTYSVNRTVSGALNVAAYLPDTITTVSFALQNAEAVADTMTVDFVGIWKERA